MCPRCGFLIWGTLAHTATRPACVWMRMYTVMASLATHTHEIASSYSAKKQPSSFAPSWSPLTPQHRRRTTETESAATCLSKPLQASSLTSQQPSSSDLKWYSCLACPLLWPQLLFLLLQKKWPGFAHFWQGPDLNRKLSNLDWVEVEDLLTTVFTAEPPSTAGKSRSTTVHKLPFSPVLVKHWTWQWKLSYSAAGILSYSAAGILDEAKQDTARGQCQFELVAACA